MLSSLSLLDDGSFVISGANICIEVAVACVPCCLYRHHLRRISLLIGGLHSVFGLTYSPHLHGFCR